MKKDEVMRLEGLLSAKKRELKIAEEKLGTEVLEKQLLQQTVETLREQQEENKKLQMDMLNTINQKFKQKIDEEEIAVYKKNIEDLESQVKALEKS